MRKFRSLKPVFFGIFILLGFFLTYLGLRINSIECKTNNGPCTTRENDILNSNKNKFALTVNRKMIVDEIKKDPRVDNVKIKLGVGIKLEALISYRNNTVDIKVLPMINTDMNATGSGVLWNRVDKMMTATATQSSFFKLWDNGYLTSIPTSDDTSGILFADKMPNTETLKSIFSQLTFIRKNFVGKYAYIQENAILIRIDDRTILLFDVQKDPEKIFETLQQIQAVTTIEKGTRLIDLRFNKPVISLNKNE